MDKKYCIFDLDGTLIDSMGYWMDTPREFLKSIGIKEEDGLEEALKMTMPMSVNEAAGYFIDKFKLDIKEQDIIDNTSQIMTDHYRNDIPLKEGADEYIKALYDAGKKLCVASATEESLIYECLERLGIAKYFDFALSCATIGVSKHKPDIYIEASKRLGGKIEDSAVYEDLLLTVKTAKDAGFYTIAKYDENQKEDWGQIEKIADESIYKWEDAIKEIK